MSTTRNLKWLAVKITPENKEELEALSEMFIGSINYLPEILLLMSIGVSHKEIRKQYEVQDDG